MLKSICLLYTGIWGKPDMNGLKVKMFRFQNLEHKKLKCVYTVIKELAAQKEYKKLWGWIFKGRVKFKDYNIIK